MLFSILIAHYNNYNYFLDCYKSIVEQSYQNFEVVIVDDCSTDDSFEKIKELTSSDVRFVLFRNEKNRGVGHTKRKCAELATGEICAFLDPDDALVSNALEISLKNHTRNNAVAYSRFLLCDGNLKPQKPFPHSRAVKNKDQLFFNVLLEANHFFTFKKSAYDKTSGIDPELTSAVDQDLYLKLYEVGDFTFIPEPLYLYRLHENGVSQNASKKNKLSENWQLVIINTLERRNIKTLYGKNIHEIEHLPRFILENQNTLFKKIQRKIQKWI